MRRFVQLTAALLVLACASSMPGYVSWVQAGSEKPRPGGTLRVKPFTQTMNTNLDPIHDGPTFLMEQLYDALVRQDKDLNLVPGLAEYWVIGELGKRYTFYLRKGVKFHHGQELTAQDVKFSLERLVSKTENSQYAVFYLPRIEGAWDYWNGKTTDVKGFRAVSKYVFEVDLVQPYVSLLYLLSMPYAKVLPRDLVQAQGRNFFLKPSGTGPFKFAYWLRSPRLEVVGVRLERNDAYFDRKPYLAAVEFSPFYTLDHFLSKEVHIFPFVSESFAGSDIQIKEDGALSTAFLGMNCRAAPFNQAQARKAVAAVLDKRKIAEIAYTSQSVPQLTDNFIPARLKGFFPSAPGSAPDLEAARRALQALGYPLQREFPRLFFIGVHTGRARRALDLSLFRELKRQLGAVGILLEWREFTTLTEVKTIPEPFLVFFEWRMDFPDPENMIGPIFVTKGYLNLMGYSSAALDKMTAMAEREKSWTQRVALFQKIERLLAEDLPAVPLFSSQQRMALQPWVRGVEVPAMGFFYLDLRKVWLDR